MRLNINNDPNWQVKTFNDTLLNIISNFIPNEEKQFQPCNPPWFNDEIKKLTRKHNLLYKKYKKKGFKDNDKSVLDQHRVTLSEAILTAKENHLKSMGNKLANPNTAQKTYWKILNTFLNKCKLPRIPPLFIDGKYVTKCSEKATHFNNYFASQCTPLNNDSTLPDFSPLTNNTLSSCQITDEDIKELLTGLNTNKAHGPDEISVRMLKICGDNLILPLNIIFTNILSTGIFPSQWKKANVTPVHKKNDKQLINNYRPISLLPVLAKVFKKIIFKHMYNHLITNNLISKN